MTTESRMREALERLLYACGDMAEADELFAAEEFAREALSPPVRRTSYEWVADGVSFRIYWFSKGRGDGLWAVERKAGDRWSPDFGLTTYASAAIATLANLTPPEDES